MAMSPTGVGYSDRRGPGGAPDAELLLSQIDTLPTLPAIAMRLLEMSLQDHVGTRDVVELIASDQSLASRLLSLVNRASSGAKVNTVERAAVLLGLNVVRNLVLSIQIFETFTQRMEHEETAFDHAGFWRHSLAVGCAARLLAEVRRGKAGSPRAMSDPEEAFMCGLLHDLGKVVLESCFPKSYTRVLSRVARMQENIIDAEQAVFGLDHTLAGKRLGLHWKLPASVCDCIWLHHHTPASTPSRLDHPQLVQVVQLADRLVREMRIGYSGNDPLDGSSLDLAREWGLDESLIEEVRQRLPDLIESRAELIGLDRLSSRDVYQEAITRANAELARLNTYLQQANRRLEQRSVCLDALRRLNEELTDQDLHEDVCRVAVEACGLVMPQRPIALLVHSPCRSVLALACFHDEESEVVVSTLRAPEGGAGWEAERRSPQWQPCSRLPREIGDELEGVLGEPGRWFLSPTGPYETCGVLVVTDETTPAADESLTVLMHAVETRLRLAEGRARSIRLNEELVEMNRALVASQADLTRARSLLMVGEMAAGAAHEMNNPLAVISGRAQILMKQLGDPEQIRSCRLIVDHAQRASAIVNELIAFAKPDPPEPDTWSPAWLLGEVRRDWVAKGALGAEEFSISLSDELPKVRADASQIRKLFDEVIRNAVEAMEEVTPRRLDINCSGHLADERIVVNIRDNGRGIPPEILDRVTTPFFSHRRAGRGRGLGLSLAVRYAEINGGRLRISSRPGEGTTVAVTLITEAGLSSQESS